MRSVNRVSSFEEATSILRLCEADERFVGVIPDLRSPKSRRDRSSSSILKGHLGTAVHLSMEPPKGVIAMTDFRMR
jgi:hypothetical protein